MDEKAIVSMIIHGLNLKGEKDIARVLRSASNYNLDFQYHDNWNGGIDYFILTFYFDFDTFTRIHDKKDEYISKAYETLSNFYKDESNVIQEIDFKVIIEQFLNWDSLSVEIKKDDILNSLSNEMNMLIDSGTGIITIKGTDNDSVYKELHNRNAVLINQLGLRIDQQFSNLWEWYGFYSQSLSSYQERRSYIHSIYDPIIKKIKDSTDTRQSVSTQNTILNLQDTMPKIRDISRQAFEEFERAIKTIADINNSSNNERARKDAVRSVASAMEAVIKAIGGTDDIKTSSRKLRDDGTWGPDEIVKEGDAIFNTLHRIYPDLRHGSICQSSMSIEETQYWIGRMVNFINYMKAKKDSLQ